jgi:hypothetical protein
MNDEVVSLFKHYIKHEMNDHITSLFEEISTSEKYLNKLDHQYIFKGVFLFCCIHREKELLEFLYENIYKSFRIVDRIALRPCIIYGKYLYKDGYPIQLPKDPKFY